MSDGELTLLIENDYDAFVQFMEDYSDDYLSGLSDDLVIERMYQEE